ncbi:MAG: nucleoside permease [Bacteroidia bacterium]
MKLNPALYGRLSLMMFFNYFIWGAWYVTMGIYLPKTLLTSGTEIGIAYGAGALAAMISPFFVGLVADRFFATERVLGVLHIVGAILLYLVSKAEDFGSFYPLILLYSICYMPTIALSNSVAFYQMSDDNKSFPWVRAWGTAGWIVAGLSIGWMDVATETLPFLIAAGASLFMGLYSFSLPHTPPKLKGQKISVREVIGLDALSLLRDRSFLVLFISSLLICVPLSFYYGGAADFLTEINFENPVGRMTFGQISEFVFLLLMPFFFRRLGVKKMILIGMAAWCVRYLAFGFGEVGGASEGLLFLGIILHGICYDFFFVTGQIYADNKAPSHLRSSVQGLMTFATYGVGMFIGTYAFGVIKDSYITKGGHDWQSIWMIPAVFSVVVLLFFMLAFNDKSAQGTASIEEDQTASDAAPTQA